MPCVTCGRVFRALITQRRASALVRGILKVPVLSKVAERDAKLHIVTQYRDKNSMIYEMECEGVELDVRVSPRETADDSGEWRIEARAGRTPGATCVTGWATTRSEALRDVGRKWVLDAGVARLPAFDWEAVGRVLAAVRAL